MARILHGVEVIEVTVELVEAVDGGEVLVAVAQMVLAELAGGVAHGFQRGGDGYRLRGNADFRASLADGGHAGANGKLAGDEVSASCGAARFGVIVGEQHAFSGHLVEIRSAASHHAAAVSANV